MKNNEICHNREAFLDALFSCMDSGLQVWADGVPLTRDSLPNSALIRESGNWTGDCLKNESGELTGLSFTQESVSNTLLPNQ